MFAISNHYAKDRARALSASYGLPGINTIGMSSGISTYYSTQTNISIQTNNLDLHQRLDFLHTQIEEVQSNLDLTTINNKARHAGVRLAWLYEAEDVKMGGRGSVEGGWKNEEIEVMQDRIDNDLGGVEGAEGHHQKSVSTHPEYQADPNNIKFFRTREEHKNIAHHGKWKNQSDDPFIDKDKMLEKTNQNRNIKAELINAITVICTAAGTGFLLGAAVVLALEGISIKNVRKAVCEGGKQAAKSTAISLAGYGLGRVVGNRITDGIIKFLQQYNYTFHAEKIALLNQTVSGVVVSTLLLVFAYIRLRTKGESHYRAISQLKPAIVMSILGLSLSIIVTKIFGKVGGTIFSVVWTGCQVAYIKDKDNKRKALYKNIEYYRLEHCMPIYAEGTVI